MRDAESGDLGHDAAWAAFEAEMRRDVEGKMPHCAVCGVLVRAVPDGMARQLVCSMACALELARREERELEELPDAG